ncbi:MAG: succinate dehydrogenase, hydrophobic membrane anchor protein [Candidatus Zixiibacteriota bacterium]|nr:MAG: succinate dehydrogenase, hydrophobic membrane anchor protein [candidate division Zixibacteria bacterium]
MERGIGSGGAFAWFFQRISGAVLVLALLLHFWVLHYSNQGEVTFEIVAQRLATPVWKTIDLTFLVLAVIHGFWGFLMIVRDYVHSKNMRLFLVAAVWTVGLVIAVMGALTIIGFHPPLPVAPPEQLGGMVQ